MTTTPPVSVVIPVSDGRFLDPCLGSICGQTFDDFEVVVVANGLAADGVAVLQEWAAKDDRIRVYERPDRMGLAPSSNEAVSHARAPLVARMDADDIAHEDRLRCQLDVFRSHPDAVVVGALADGIDGGGRTVRPRDRARLLRQPVFSPFPHGSVVFRRDAFDAVGGYRANSSQEDLDLLIRMSALGRVLVLPEVLYHYRYHTGSATAGRAAAYGEPGMAGVTHGGYYIWAGERPPKHLRTVRGSRDLGAAARSLLYATWGAASPVTLRAALAAGVRLRDRLASRRVGEGPVEWRFASSS